MQRAPSPPFAPFTTLNAKGNAARLRLGVQHMAAIAFAHGWLGHPLQPFYERPTHTHFSTLANASVSLVDRTRGDVAERDDSHTNASASTSLPSNGRVAFLVRGEAYRLGGRNLDTAQAGGCNEEGAESQNQATHSLLKLLVQPLEARGESGGHVRH